MKNLLVIIFMMAIGLKTTAQEATFYLYNGSIIVGEYVKSKNGDKVKVITSNGSTIYFTEKGLEKMVEGNELNGQSQVEPSMENATVYLKNGSKIIGKLNDSGKKKSIETSNGSIVYFTDQSIKNIIKEEDEIVLERPKAQTDSLTQEIRSYVARNFSEARTFNLYWQTTPTHDYTLKRNGSNMEKGEMREKHAIQFSGTIPIVTGNKFSLSANWQTNFHVFETINEANGGTSSVFFDSNNEDKDSYSYHRATINGTYKTRIGNKPLIFNASISGDGWNEGFEKVFGSISVIIMLKRTQNSSFSIGLSGMTLYNVTPVVPLISYERLFNQNLSLEVLLPSRAYLRYQFANNHRFSLGAVLESENFYMKPGITDLPKTCFFQETTIKPQIAYEYIINKRFYLIARGGISSVVQGGLYGTDRKGIDNDPYIEYTRPTTPFFNLGFSYNIFK